MAPPIAVEDITSATAFTEGHPTVVGLFPSGEKPTEFQQRVGRFAIDTGGDRRIHGLTISTVFADGEVTNVPLLWATRASRGPSWAAIRVKNPSTKPNGLSPTLAREHTQLAGGMNLTMLAAVTDRVNRARLAARFEPASDRCCVVLDVD